MITREDPKWPSIPGAFTFTISGPSIVTPRSIFSNGEPCDGLAKIAAGYRKGGHDDNFQDAREQGT